VVANEEIVWAIEQLNEVGLWARSAENIESELERSGSARLITGSNQPPQPVHFNGIANSALSLSGDNFDIVYHRENDSYTVVFKLRMVEVIIRKSRNFEDVVSSLIGYAELQSRNLLDPISILEALFQLKQAGLSIEISNEAAIDARDKLHTFQIYPEASNWVVQVDHFPGIQFKTLVAAVRKVIEFYDVQ
jgi:hypothetical protein